MLITMRRWFWIVCGCVVWEREVVKRRDSNHNAVREEDGGIAMAGFESIAAPQSVGLLRVKSLFISLSLLSLPSSFFLHYLTHTRATHTRSYTTKQLLLLQLHRSSSASWAAAEITVTAITTSTTSCGATSAFHMLLPGIADRQPSWVAPCGCG
jgi:hypothetical protein